jgi:hypothetical protein
MTLVPRESAGFSKALIRALPRELDFRVVLRSLIKIWLLFRARFRLLFIEQTPPGLKHALSQPWVRVFFWLEDRWPALRAPEPADRMRVDAAGQTASFHHLQTVFPTLTFRQVCANVLRMFLLLLISNCVLCRDSNST